MKKIIILFTLLLISLFNISCADKKAFIASKPVAESALVYVYIEEDENIDDTMRTTKYNVVINGNLSSESLKPGEYVKLDVKPKALTVSLARTDLEIQSVKLNPQAGETYYLRAQSESNGFGKFNFINVDSSVGSIEIANNVSSSEYLIEGNIIDALVKDDKEAANTSKMSESEINALIEQKLKAMKTPQVNSTQSSPSTTTSTSATGSKLDDIRNAYEMKKQGVLTEEEFLKMKAEILAK